MGNISASDVKKLREMTGAGMMKCKEALSQCDGNVQNAVDFLRKKGLAEAQKRQSRVAAEGIIVTLTQDNQGVILELNCETDFVAKGDDFQSLGQRIAQGALKSPPESVEALVEREKEVLNQFALRCGEKIHLRRFLHIGAEGGIGSYNHGGRMGVLVETNGGDLGQLKDLAMHIGGMKPLFVSADKIDDDFKKREAEIYTAQLKEEGKPEAMIPRIVEGKLKKMAKDICLLEQAFLKDPDKSVKEFLGNITVKRFIIYRLGEGVEKNS